MQMHEPMTTLTDYVLAIVCIVLASQLFRLWRVERQRAVLLWGLALIATALAALLGGTFHGFGEAVGERGAGLLWLGTTWSIGLASFALTVGSLFGAVRPPMRRWLIAVAAGKLVFYLIWMISHDAFIYPIIDYGSSMIAVLLLCGIRWSDRAFRWLAAGIVTAFGASAIQQARIGFGAAFDHNAVYHVIQMGAVWLLYRGARILRDRSEHQ
ncbi:MAG TPA: hypothetical protein VNM92_13470 [Thermoanaerobaculia bacterium]|nr:hypothetical protein [Thermoanaerobaculia bacterium]